MERLTHGLIRKLRREGELSKALLGAASMVEANPADLTAWHLLASALRGGAKEVEAARALAALSAAYARAGDLPMALVAALEHSDAGGDAKPLLEALAEEYSNVAEALADDWQVAPPPVPPPAVIDLEAADDAECLSAMIDAALKDADKAAAKRDQAIRRYFPLLSALSPAAFVRFAATLWPMDLGPEDVVVEQGALGDSFYIVARGEVRVIRAQSDGQEALLARLGSGGFFGEMAIVAQAPRAARVQTADDAVLLRADMETLTPLTEEIPELKEVMEAFCRARMLENAVLASPALARVPMEERPGLFSRFSEHTHELGEVVIEEGFHADGLHLIVSGEVEVTHSEGEEVLTIARLGPGDLFGEVSLVLRRPANATVTATSDAICLVLPSESFMDVIHTFPGFLAELYVLAVKRDEETRRILAREAVDADDLVMG